MPSSGGKLNLCPPTQNIDGRNPISFHCTCAVTRTSGKRACRWITKPTHSFWQKDIFSIKKIYFQAPHVYEFGLRARIHKQNEKLDEKISFPKVKFSNRVHEQTAKKNLFTSSEKYNACAIIYRVDCPWAVVFSGQLGQAIFLLEGKLKVDRRILDTHWKHSLVVYE